MKKLLSLFTALVLMGGMMTVQAVDYYLAGTFNGWNTTNDANLMSLESGTIYSKTISGLGATDYKFKVSTYNWGSDWGSGTIDNSQSNVTLGGTNDITFTLDAVSDVTFYFDAGETKKIYVQATPASNPPASFTIPAGTVVYYDFKAYGSGINVYAPGSPSDWYASSAEVISVTLSSDWVISASTNLFKSEASGWSFVTGTVLPTDGQNMIVSTDGVNYLWGTYVPSSDPGEDPGQVTSYTFPAGTVVYYDFKAYGSGINVYAPGSPSDWYASSAEVISVTLSSDWVISASTNLFKSAASNWSFVTGTVLPTDGQNMIVSTDGVNYSWGTYVPSSDPGQDSGQDPEPTQTTITIKGKVPVQWTNNIYVYVFGTTDANGFHAATKEGEWWSYTYTGASTSINAIFVNGDDWNENSNQTEDINAISEDACYQVSYNSTGKCAVATADCQSSTPSVDPEGPAVIRLSGDFVTPGTWMDTEDFAGDEESVSLKMNLLEGNYVFGVVINDVMFVNGTAFNRDNKSAAITDGNQDMTFDADVDGEYTFTWTYETNTLSIVYPAEQTPEYATIKFFAPRDQTNKWDHIYAYATKGNKKDFGPKPGTEITDKDAEWYVVTVRKGSNLLFTDNAGMETELIEDIQEDACYVSTAINYYVYPKIVSLTKQCNVDYYVAGDEGFTGNNWDPANAACKFDENNQVIFHDVPAGSYQFKITNGSWAWSIGGNDFLSDEPGCGTIASEVDLGNTGFTIDEVQDVTITYYPATRKICLGAMTVKTIGELTADDINLYVDELKSPSFITNIEGYTAADVELTIVSGGAYVQLVDGQIKGIAEGTAEVKIAIAETALFTGAEANFNVTVSAIPVPPTPDYGSYQRPVTNGNYGTICLPKAGVISGATLFDIADFANEMIYVDEVIGGVMEAGKPYIFQATSEQLNVAYSSDTEVDAGVANGLYGFYDLTGVDHVLTLPEDQGYYILYQNQYWLVNSPAYISEYRAYIRIDEINYTAPAPGRRRVAMTVNGRQTPTGFDEISQEPKANSQKLLINGELFILRGEKLYDATGRLVK